MYSSPSLLHPCLPALGGHTSERPAPKPGQTLRFPETLLRTPISGAKTQFSSTYKQGNPRLPTNSSAARRTAPKESVSLVRLVARQKLDGFPRFAHRSPPNGLVPVGCCVCTLRNLRCWSSRRACPLPGIRRRAEPLWRLDNLRTCQTQLAPGLDGRSRYQEGSA
jgi:hypothetical protein